MAPVLPPDARNAPRGSQFLEDYFNYNVDFFDLAADATQQGNIQIQADSAFKWTAAAVQCDLDGAAYTAETRPIPLCTLQMIDTGSGRQLFFNPIPVETVFGWGGLPFILPVPRIFMPRSNITFTITNFSVDQTYDVRLILSGTKVFSAGGNVP